MTPRLHDMDHQDEDDGELKRRVLEERAIDDANLAAARRGPRDDDKGGPDDIDAGAPSMTDWMRRLEEEQLQS